MAQIFQGDAVAVTNGTAVVTTAETVAVTGNPLSLPYNNAKVRIRGNVVLTPGTSTTGVTVRIRRGTTITDTLIGPATNQTAGVTAAAPQTFPIAYTDTLAGVVQAQYSLTVQQAGAAANGTIVSANIESEVLSG